MRVHLRDGDTRDVPIPDRRKRWDQVTRTVDALDWVRIEVIRLVGKKEHLLGGVEAEDAPPSDDVVGIEDLKPDAMARVFALIIKAQDQSAARHEKIVSMAMDRLVALTDTVIKSVNAMADIYAHALGLAKQQATTDGSKSNSDKLIDALMPQLLPKIMDGLDFGRKKPASPNGAG